MSPKSWIAALGALTVLALGASAHAAAPEFRSTTCAGDYSGVTQKIDCGNLIVDEARGKADSRRISVAVAIVRASTPKAGLPPVIYLHGGPGGAAVASLPRLLRRPAAKEYVGVDQDWIFIDQRGGGLSDPSLDCPGTHLTDVGPPSDQDADGIVACLQAFKAQGVDLSRYNAVEVARDVQDLRKALKLDKIDLFGGSYGTRIEAAIQVHAPEGVRAVVQDSPWPPEAGWTVGGPEMVSGSIDIVMAKCAVVDECAKRYPDLKAKLSVVAERWLAGPQTVGGKTYTADDLGGYLMDASYFNAAYLPRDLWKIIEGDVSPVEEFVGARDYYREGQFMTHLCKEELPFESRAAIATGAGKDPVARLMVASMQRLHDICKRVDVGPISPAEQAPVKTAIPTLFLAAEIDPDAARVRSRRAAGSDTTLGDLGRVDARRPRPAASIVDEGHRLVRRLHDICKRVDVGPILPAEQAPVKTAIPTLFLAAEIDPGCPPDLTKAAAKGYAGSQVVIVTNATHGVTSRSACARKMVRAFFQDPSQPVDRSCLPAADQPMTFVYD